MGLLDSPPEAGGCMPHALLATNAGVLVLLQQHDRSW